jgi:hypothetical protein
MFGILFEVFLCLIFKRSFFNHSSSSSVSDYVLYVHNDEETLQNKNFGYLETTNSALCYESSQFRPRGCEPLLRKESIKSRYSFNLLPLPCLSENGHKCPYEKFQCSKGHIWYK